MFGCGGCGTKLIGGGDGLVLNGSCIKRWNFDFDSTLFCISDN